MDKAVNNEIWDFYQVSMAIDYFFGPHRARIGMDENSKLTEHALQLGQSVIDKRNEAHIEPVGRTGESDMREKQHNKTRNTEDQIDDDSSRDVK